MFRDLYDDRELGWGWERRHLIRSPDRPSYVSGFAIDQLFAIEELTSPLYDPGFSSGLDQLMWVSFSSNHFMILKNAVR